MSGKRFAPPRRRHQDIGETIAVDVAGPSDLLPQTLPALSAFHRQNPECVATSEIETSELRRIEFGRHTPYPGG